MLADLIALSFRVRPLTMSLDPSAVLAIVLVSRVLRDSPAPSPLPSCKTSAASILEASMVAESRAGDTGLANAMLFSGAPEFPSRGSKEEQTFLARQGLADYGKGRHPASLNFGDCFSYALANPLSSPSSAKTTTSARPTLTFLLPQGA